MLLLSCTFNCKILFTWKIKIPIWIHSNKIYTVQIEEDVFLYSPRNFCQPNQGGILETTKIGGLEYKTSYGWTMPHSISQLWVESDVVLQSGHQIK